MGDDEIEMDIETGDEMILGEDKTDEWMDGCMYDLG
jgi:hypothetical protein